jgi:hypothetical protein
MTYRAFLFFHGQIPHFMTTQNIGYFSKPARKRAIDFIAPIKDVKSMFAL